INILGLGYNPTKSEEVAFIVRGSVSSGAKFFLGANTTWVAKASFTVSGNYTGNLTFGGGKWIWDYHQSAHIQWRRFSIDGATLEFTSADFGQDSKYWHTRAGTSATIFKPKPPIFGSTKEALLTTDNAANITEYDISQSFGAFSAISPDGLYILANWDP